MSKLRYFHSSIIVTIVGVALAFFLGFQGSDFNGAIKTVFLVLVLSILEISLSFDNAVVNATILKDMTPKWRHRFMTWGMLIAVFGMRLIFPLVIVSLVARIGPLEALNLAIFKPHDYEKIMLSVHTELGAFGGFFLLMVAMKYFFDREKDVHWIGFIEKYLVKFGRLEAFELGLSLSILLAMSSLVAKESQLGFITYGVAGIITFVFINGIGTFLEGDSRNLTDAHRASLGMFLYLEIIDASFSFDGVIGAFALTNNLFLIAIGLGIGAMFVRSLTILLVEAQTLNKYKYLEHGAFYAIAILAILMVINTFHHIPEVVTGLTGVVFIITAFLSSRGDPEKL